MYFNFEIISLFFTETLFNVIAEGGPMHDLVKLVKGEPELEMCFRGNSGDGFIIVYYNNHVVFRG